jgi:hypothetical protein
MGNNCGCVKDDRAKSLNLTESPSFMNFSREVKIIKIQNKIRTFLAHKKLKFCRKANFLIQMFRPELKEVDDDSFKPSVTDKITEILNSKPTLISSEEIEKKMIIKKGPVLFPDNSIYIGSWNDVGNREGYGFLFDSNKFYFEGIFKNDQLNGQGRKISPEGEVYEGEFENGKASGFGIFKSNEGVIYRGEWKDDLQHGNGEEIFPDGNVYIGEFYFGDKHGKGKLEMPDNSTYEGEFNYNNLHGSGVFIYSNGNKYIGEWKNNKMEGYGEFFWPDGQKYKGYYKNDKKWGHGEFTNKENKTYVGEFFKGKMNGQFIIYENGKKKISEWRMGKKLRETDFVGNDNIDKTNEKT